MSMIRLSIKEMKDKQPTVELAMKSYFDLCFLVRAELFRKINLFSHKPSKHEGASTSKKEACRSGIETPVPVEA